RRLEIQRENAGSSGSRSFAVWKNQHCRCGPPQTELPYVEKPRIWLEFAFLENVQPLHHGHLVFILQRGGTACAKAYASVRLQDGTSEEADYAASISTSPSQGRGRDIEHVTNRLHAKIQASFRMRPHSISVPIAL